MTESIDAYRGFIECQIRCEDKKDELAAYGRRPFVTISRQTGAAAITIGNLLVDFLNKHEKTCECPWTVFDKSLVETVLEKTNLPKDIERFMPEKKISEIKDIIDTLFQLHPPAFALAHETSETIMQLAQMGRTVIVGRGGNLVTRKLKGGVHVRLVGSFEKRARHAQEYYELDYDDAVKRLKEDDKDREEYIKQNFGRKINNPQLYDLVINTDHLSNDLVAKIIGDCVLEKVALYSKKA